MWMKRRVKGCTRRVVVGVGCDGSLRIGSLQWIVCSEEVTDKESGKTERGICTGFVLCAKRHHMNFMHVGVTIFCRYG